MKRLFWSLMLCSLLVVAAHAQADDTFQTMMHDGVERSYHIYEPENDPTGLLFVLHPFASNGRAMEFVTGFNPIANANDWVVVYPNSVDFYWDDGRSDVGLPPDNGAIDDLGFLQTLRDDLAGQYGLERESIFLSGFAQGGNMAYAVACQLSESFGGVAVVAALMWEYQVEQCSEPSTPVDMLIIHGLQDPTYRAQGNEIGNAAVGNTWRILGVNDTFDFWRGRFECSNDAIPTGTSIVWHQGCADGVSTAFRIVSTGKYNWPRQGEYILNQFGFDASETIAAFFSADGSIEDNAWVEVARSENSPETPEEARSYILYVPSNYDPETPTPLAVMLHGRTVNANSQAYTDDMRTIAEREGFIVVHPNGINNEWNYGEGIGFYAQADQQDEKFLNDLVDDLALDLNIDAQRVYVGGLSNGGLMSQRLACTSNDRFAAFAPVAATAPFGLSQFCGEEGAPVPILFIQGDADTIMPWDGVRTRVGGREVFATAPMVNTLQFWVDTNNCSTTYDFEELPQVDPETLTQVYDFNCPNDSALVLYGVDGGGHVWPGVRDFDNPTLGEVSQDFNASEVIWEFFSQYTLDMPAGEDDAETATSDEPIVLRLGTQAETEDFAPSAEQIANAQLLVSTLQQGGFVIYVHHMPFVEEFESCEDTLTDAGIAEAEAIRDAFEALEIPVGEIITAENCVWVQTAQTAFGDVTRSLEGLDPQTLFLFMSRLPNEGTNSIIVGDGASLQATIGAQLLPGQSLIVQPLESAGFEPITGMPVGGWALLTEFITAGETNAAEATEEAESDEMEDTEASTESDATEEADE